MISTRSLQRTVRRARKSTTARTSLSMCKVVRSVTGGVFDDNTGVWTPPTLSTVYEGAGFAERQPRPSVVDREDTALTIETPMLRVPWKAPTFQIGDTVVFTASNDPTVAGRSWRITALPFDSYGVHRSYPLAEVTVLDVDI